MPMIRDARKYSLLSRSLAEVSDSDGDARETFTNIGSILLTVYPLSSKEASEIYGKVNGDVCLGLTKTSKKIGIGDKLTTPTISGSSIPIDVFPENWSEMSEYKWNELSTYPWNTVIHSYKVVGCTQYSLGAYQLDLWRE